MFWLSQPPQYKVEVYDSSGNFLHGFGYGYANKITSLRVKPGITNAVGSFEIVIPDIQHVTGSPGTFSNIPLFGNVYIGLVNSGDPGNSLFRGKIETIKTKLTTNGGLTRTLIGRGYGECLFRIFKREVLTGSTSNIVKRLRNSCTGSIYGGLSTSDTYIETSTTPYTIVSDNQNVFSLLKEISDFDVKDFYIDINKILHWFSRQSQTGSEVFTTGSNILKYTIDKDISYVKNDIYVFGMRDSSFTGSDIPPDHDSWTENDTSGWTAHVVSGSGESDLTVTSSTDSPSTGSYFIETDNYWLGNGDESTVWLKKTLPNTILLTNDDIIHFYQRRGYGLGDYAWTDVTWVRIQTDDDNYFECKLEGMVGQTETEPPVLERTLSVGPRYEGESITGSKYTTTGSYKWTAVGNPDWFNINSVKFIYKMDAGADTYASAGVDGFYFGTRFQATRSDTSSQNSYGYRPYIEINKKLNSNQYCQNRADTLLSQLKDPITQIRLTVTGSPGLQVGKRYKVTIGSENIDKYFELIDLTHIFDGRGFVTECILTDKKEIRTPIPTIDYPTQVVTKDKSWWDIIMDFFSPRPVSIRFKP